MKDIKPTVTLSASSGLQAGQRGILRVRLHEFDLEMEVPPRMVELMALMNEARDSSADLLGETHCGFLSRHCILAKLDRDLQLQTLSRYVSDFKRTFLAARRKLGSRMTFRR